jgi:hypothetical protein
MLSEQLADYRPAHNDHGQKEYRTEKRAKPVFSVEKQGDYQGKHQYKRRGAYNEKDGASQIYFKARIQIKSPIVKFQALPFHGNITRDHLNGIQAYQNGIKDGIECE